MAKLSVKNPLSKRALIEKANSSIVTVTAIAAFISVFCLISSKALLSQASYQNRIISAKKQAKQQLISNINNVQALSTSYIAFVTTPQNAIGGNPSGTGPNDGNNAKIVLDSLPSQYDFPALVTSVEALLKQQQVTIQSISGVDLEPSATGPASVPSSSSSSQSTSSTSSSSSSSNSSVKPIAMPFSFSIQSNYTSMQSVVKTFQSSIRPFQFNSVELAVGGGQTQDQLTMTINAQTYYQPAKVFKLGSKVIK